MKTLFKQWFGLQWHITDICDQRCKHCYIFQTKNGERKKELNSEECLLVLEKYLQFCEEIKCNPGFVITGGDPLLSPVFWELANAFNQKEIEYTILGNPFHLSLDVCRKLKDSGCIYYQLSLDGMRETHDKFRQPGSFDETLKALTILKESEIKTKIMSTVSKVNYLEMPEIVNLCLDYEVDIYAFARYAPTHCDADDMISPDEYRSFLKVMWDLYCKEANKGTIFSLKDHLWKLFLYETGELKVKDSYNIYDGCNCGIRHLTLLPDGEMYACRRFVSPIGNILNQSFEEIFFGQQIEKYRQYDEYEACAKCELLTCCRGCGAVSYGVTGNYYSKDPQCWKK